MKLPYSFRKKRKIIEEKRTTRNDTIQSTNSLQPDILRAACLASKARPAIRRWHETVDPYNSPLASNPATVWYANSRNPTCSRSTLKFAFTYIHKLYIWGRSISVLMRTSSTLNPFFMYKLYCPRAEKTKKNKKQLSDQ